MSVQVNEGSASPAPQPAAQPANQNSANQNEPAQPRERTPMSVQDAAERFAARLGHKKLPPRPGEAQGANDNATAQNQSQPHEGDDASRSDKAITGDSDRQGDDTADKPSVAPPASWSNEDKAYWNTLPPSLQKSLAERERQRDLNIRRSQDEVASQRKAIEADRAAATQERQRYAERVNELSTFLQQQLNPFAQIDWNKLYESDPLEYTRKQAQYRDYERAAQQAEHERQALAAKAQQEQEAARQDWLKGERARLLEAVPEWADESKAKAGAKEVSDYLVGQGIPVDRLAMISAAETVLARKAMLWDRLQAEKAQTLKRVENVPRVLKPGAPRDTRDVESERIANARAQLRKGGTLEDAANLFRAKGLR